MAALFGFLLGLVIYLIIRTLYEFGKEMGKREQARADALKAQEAKKNGRKRTTK